MNHSTLLKVSLVLLWSMAGTMRAELPDSAHIEGIRDFGWERGMCHVASFGNLLDFALADPNLASYQLAVRSSDMTQAAWMSGSNGNKIYSHPRWLQAGPLIDMSRLCGVGIHVGYGAGGPLFEAEFAETITVFKDQTQAVSKLKTLIAEGIPIQVHVDMYYLGQNPHCDHRVVVHGYDADYIYYTDNGEAGTKENIALPWEDFLDGWSLTPQLNPQNPAPPYIMCYITEVPVLADDTWTVTWLALDALYGTPDEITGPDAIRKAADAIRAGDDPNYILGDSLSVFDNQRPYFAQYLESLELDELAETWRQGCTGWENVFQYAQTDWALVPDVLDDIADKEESVLNALAAWADQVDEVALFVPGEGENADDPGQLIFRWLPLPDISEQVVLQFALTGDFDDAGHVVTVKTSSEKNSTQVSVKDWLKILAKDDGDKHLSWRIVGKGKKTLVNSASRDLSWSSLEMTALMPADSAAAVADESLVFTFSAPSLAQAPVIVFSTNGDFADKKTLINLKVKKGQSQAELTSKYLTKLQKKDEGDGVVYWRVEDSKSKKSTVGPSEIRTLYLP